MDIAGRRKLICLRILAESCPIAIGTNVLRAEAVPVLRNANVMSTEILK